MIKTNLRRLGTSRRDGEKHTKLQCAGAKFNHRTLLQLAQNRLGVILGVQERVHLSVNPANRALHTVLQRRLWLPPENICNETIVGIPSLDANRLASVKHEGCARRLEPDRNKGDLG
jgi:hypothetical protein